MNQTIVFMTRKVGSIKVYHLLTMYTCVFVVIHAERYFLEFSCIHFSQQNSFKNYIEFSLSENCLGLRFLPNLQTIY